MWWAVFDEEIFMEKPSLKYIFLNFVKISWVINFIVYRETVQILLM